MVSSAPLVSIIIPAKNEAENIGRCLRSISSIDYPSGQYEVIVVDNGSQDNTVNIAQSLGAKVFIKPNLSISGLRNYGAAHSRGKILSFLDADCTVMPDWLQSAEKYFDTENIAAFGSAPRIPDQASWVQKSWFLVRRKKEKVTETDWLESMNMFVPRHIFELIGGFDEKLITCEDVDLSYRLVRHGRILSDQKIVAIHHGEAGDIKTFFKKERWRGKSNYLGLKRHGLRLKEIPSLALPLYYLFFFASIILFSVMGGFRGAVVSLFLLQFPIVVSSIIKIKTRFSVIPFLQLIFLYNIYYMARGLAIFG